MASRETEKFRKWAQEVANKLPDNLRNSWVAVTQNDFDGQDELVNAFLRQDDYTRKTTSLSKEQQKLQERAEELEAERSQLVDWYNQANSQHQALYNEYMQLRNGNPSHRQQDTAVDQMAALKREKDELLQRIRQVDQGAWTMATRLSALSHRSLKEGYSFDPDAIAAYSAKNQVPLETAWEALTADERRQKQEEDVNKRIEAAKEEARKDALSKISPPDSFGRSYSSEPSMVDAIRSNSGVSNDHQRQSEALKAFYEAGQGGS